MNLVVSDIVFTFRNRTDPPLCNLFITKDKGFEIDTLKSTPVKYLPYFFKAAAWSFVKKVKVLFE